MAQEGNMLTIASSPRLLYTGAFVAGILLGMIVALKWTI
jgi:hypothetical protein